MFQTNATKAGSRRVLRLLTLTIAVALAPILHATDSEAAPLTSKSTPNLYNIDTKKCLDIPGLNRGKINGPIIQAKCDFTKVDNQRFYAVKRGTYRGGTIYIFRNKTDGYCLDLPGFGSVAPGTRVSEFRCAPSGDNQLFYTEAVGKNVVLLHSMASPELCLDVEGFKDRRANQHLGVYTCARAGDDHRWALITSAKAIKGLAKPEAPAVVIQWIQGGWCLDSNFDRAAYMLKCNGSPYQRWDLSRPHKGSRDLQIRNFKTNMCLDSGKPGVKGAGEVYMGPCNGGDYQRWYEAEGGNLKEIKDYVAGLGNRATRLCIHVESKFFNGDKPLPLATWGLAPIGGEACTDFWSLRK